MYGKLQLFRAVYQLFRAQYVFPRTLTEVPGIFPRSDSHKLELFKKLSEENLEWSSAPIPHVRHSSRTASNRALETRNP